jgi:hypothetical protein
MEWTTALPGLGGAHRSGRSLVPCKPIFPDEAAAALDVFKSLRVVDVAGCPTFAEAGDDRGSSISSRRSSALMTPRERQAADPRVLPLRVQEERQVDTSAAVMLTALIRNWRHSNELTDSGADDRGGAEQL